MFMKNCFHSIEIIRKAPQVVCHVFESEEANFIAQSIGQAFQVAYTEFLRTNGIEDPNYLRDIDYQEVLNSQEMMAEELELLARKETQKVLCNIYFYRKHEIVIWNIFFKYLGCNYIQTCWRAAWYCDSRIRLGLNASNIGWKKFTQLFI